MGRLSQQQESERNEDLARLRGWIKPGDTLYTILRHVARSGMQRTVSVVLGGEEPMDISGYAAVVLGMSRDDKTGGVKVGGCGMDAGFHVVHNLSYALFPDSFTCVGEHCPANDHSNGDHDYTPHQHSKGAAGYALRQRWL